MMRCPGVKIVAILATCCGLAPNRSPAENKPEPSIELQSEAITPGLILAESLKPIHQVRILADIGRPGVSQGTLVLDPNAPAFDEFGALVGGVVTPQSVGKRGTLPEVKLECRVESVKAGRGEQDWHLYRLTSPNLKSTLMVSTQGPITSSGAARLLIVGKGKRVESVVPLTRYGLIVP